MYLSILPMIIVSQHPPYDNCISESSLWYCIFCTLPIIIASQHPPYDNCIPAPSIIIGSQHPYDNFFQAPSLWQLHLITFPIIIVSPTTMHILDYKYMIIDYLVNIYVGPLHDKACYVRSNTQSKLVSQD